MKLEAFKVGRCPLAHLQVGNCPLLPTYPLTRMRVTSRVLIIFLIGRQILKAHNKANLKVFVSHSHLSYSKSNIFRALHVVVAHFCPLLPTLNPLTEIAGSQWFFNLFLIGRKGSHAGTHSKLLYHPVFQVRGYKAFNLIVLGGSTKGGDRAII